MELLGESFDIHCGGEDNIFPHHENEIAQSESATGKQFVKYWLHSRHLRVEGEKMAKSAGNFFTLRDLTEKGYNPVNVRFVLIRQHYRDPLNFTFDGLKAAAEERRRWTDLLIRLDELDVAGEVSDSVRDLCAETDRGIEAALDDDLNTPRAFARLHELTTQTNKRIDPGEITRTEAVEIEAVFRKWDSVFGVLDEKKGTLDEEIESLIREREQARTNKNFARSDAIREELTARGIILEDTPHGTRWKRGES